MKNKFTRSSFDSRQKGQDLVEFALVLPILLLIMFGVLDLGRLFHAAITITNAARVGARFGTRNKEATDGEIRAATRDEAFESGIDLSTAPIDIDYLDILPLGLGNQDGNDDTIQVKITYDFPLIIDYILSLTNIQIVRQAEIRFR